MSVQAAVVRVGVVASDAHLAEQVTRLVEVAGAVRADAGEPVDVVVVEHGPAGGGTGWEGRTAPLAPVVRVCLRRLQRAPVETVVPDSAQVLELPADAEPLLRHLASLGLVARATLVGLIAARGGAGASTLACALARVSAAAGARTALVDLDGASGGLDLLLGAEHEPGPRWADLRSERAGFPPEALRMALPLWEGVRVLSTDARGGPVPADPGGADAIRALASEHDVVVLDLPRNGPWTPDEAAPASDLPSPDVLLVVALCDVRSAAAASRIARRAGPRDVRLVVRTPGPGGLDPLTLADACGLPLAATTRTERGSAAAAERGEAPGDHGRGSVARTARRLVTALGLRP